MQEEGEIWFEVQDPIQIADYSTSVFGLGHLD